jgi:hypothetical protein
MVAVDAVRADAVDADAVEVKIILARPLALCTLLQLSKS